MESFLDLLQHLWNGDVWGFLLENKFKTCSFAALLLVVYFVYQIAQEPIKAIKSFNFSASITITEHQQNFDMMDAFAGKLIGVDRAGINWVADTYHTTPLNSQMTREQDKSTGFWKFQKTDTETRYNIGFGTWWFLWRQRLVFVTKTAPEAGQAATPAAIRISIFLCPFLQSVRNLLEDAREAYQEGQESVTLVYFPAQKLQRQKGSANWKCIQPCKLSRDIGSINVNNGKKRQILEYISDFISPERARFCADCGIPNHLGLLLYGRSGTGKTSTAFAIAGTFRLDIYILSLNSPDMTEDDLATLFNDLPPACIVLLEDIDVAGIKVDRSPNSTTGAGIVPALSLAAILNALDGVSTPDGVIFIGTANYVGVLDDALKRPGRFDLAIEFNLASQEDIKGIFLRIYSRFDNAGGGKESKLGEYGDIEAAADVFAASVPAGKFSGAEVQRCRHTFSSIVLSPEKLLRSLVVGRRQLAAMAGSDSMDSA